MKGRANYLCLHRLDQLRSGMGGYRLSRLGRSVAGLRLDDGRVAENDRDRRSRRAGELPEDSSEWHDVSATAETCLGSDCPRYDDCFVTRMRQRAAESDLVIVNHHLLCADASVRQSSYGEVIPPSRYAVLDEAHQLEDVATQYFGIAVSNYRVDELVRDAERALNFGEIDDDDGELRRELRRIDDHARGFFGRLRRRGNRAGVDGAPETSVCESAPTGSATSSTRALALIGALDRLSSDLERLGGVDRRRAGIDRQAKTPPRSRGEPPRSPSNFASCSRRRTRPSSTFSKPADAACSCARRPSTCRGWSGSCWSIACTRPCSPRPR